MPLSITIGHKSVKRKIEGDFSICCSPDDAKILIDALNQIVTRDAFGWVDVRFPLSATVNTTPRAWDA